MPAMPVKTFLEVLMDSLKLTLSVHFIEQAVKIKMDTYQCSHILITIHYWHSQNACP
jgi:hypothetical protein